MPPVRLTLDDLSAWLRGATSGPELTSPVVVVDLDGPAGAPKPDLHAGLAAVVVGRTRDAGSPTELCDLVVADDDELADVVACVTANPIAAVALAGLLRGSEERTIESGLVAESGVYSSLQGGPELAAWRAGRPRRDRPNEDRPPVHLERNDGVLQVTLDRPHVRNALSTAMRDALVEAFTLPALDPTITAVHLRGAGPDFCAGGDLDEFGTFPDPATAHVVRLQQSVGRRMAVVADRVTAHLHGACVGSGIELPAFAGRVVADPGARIALPEVGLGLVPGAGGTVSLPRRIGRHRTAWLALTGRTIDAATALAWGLVDEIADEPRRDPGQPEKAPS